MSHQTYYRHLIGQDPITLKRVFADKLFRRFDPCETRINLFTTDYIGRKYFNMDIAFCNTAV